MVNRGGLSYWVPMNDKSNGIHTLGKWDQAFWIFSKIYLEAKPREGPRADPVQSIQYMKPP